MVHTKVFDIGFELLRLRKEIWLFAGARSCSAQSQDNLRSGARDKNTFLVVLVFNIVGKASSFHTGGTSFMFKEAGELYCYCVIKLEGAGGSLGNRKGQEEKQAEKYN